jgi:hypothetical protein
MKQGQITMFIIIGIILLFSIGFVVYLTTQRAVKPVEAQTVVPEDVRPVYEFVQACANDIGKEGLGLLGMQGGFINLPGIIDRTPGAYVPLDSAGYFKVPLWYYEGEDRVPSTGFMERELSRYVNERLRECTGGFEPFAGRFTIVEEGNISTRTMITDEEVVLRITWPLALTAGDRTTKTQDYVVRMPARLKQMWQLANATMAMENKHAVFENVTIDLMAADGEHVPLDGLTFECGVKRWNVNEVRERIQRLLYYNIPATRIRNTDYFPFSARTSTYETLHKDYVRMTREAEQDKPLTPPKTEAPDDAYQYFKLFYDIGARPTDLKMGFEYQPDWGMQLNAQPNDGAVLKSNTGKGASRFLRYLCINQWHFTYDIIYPVKVSVRDDRAFNGDGFVFQFAFPVIISDNEAARRTFGLKRFTSMDFGAPEFCTTYGDTLADIRALGAIEGVPVLMELDGAHITFDCLSQTCDLGTTSADAGVYRLSAYLPSGCANPFITASKEGYLSETEQLLGDRLDLRLTKLQDMRVRFVVHPYHGQTKTWGAVRDLRKDERVSLRVALVNTSFEQFIGFPTVNETLQVAQDTAHYDIDAVLLLRDNQIGGYHAPLLKIPYDDVAGKETAVIHVVEYLPAAITDEQKLDMIAYVMDGDYRETLRPEFE